MRIGIDIEALRWEATGIHNYVWNTVEWLCRLKHAHHLTLFLYGIPKPDELTKQHQWQHAFPQAKLKYFWDGITPQRVADHLGDRLYRLPPPVIRLIERLDCFYLLPLWRKLMLARSSFGDVLWRHKAPSQVVDVMHHPMGLFFPLHERANVLTFHDFIPYHFPRFCPKLTKVWFADCLVRPLDRVDLIITTSHQTKRDLVEILGVEAEKIRPIHLAAHERFRPIEDQERLAAVADRYGLGKRPYLLNVATLVPHKNQERLIEAFDRLRQEEPGLDHQLVLVGSGGWMSRPILATVRRLHLERHVRWLGYVATEDLPVLMSGADAFVFPTLYEGFGLPPLEAMACGTPVIASNSS
jgi:glycosyltransferase involved in cell wall biosynthesis